MAMAGFKSIKKLIVQLYTLSSLIGKLNYYPARMRKG